MGDFIARYWIEVFFSLVVTGLSIALKRFYSLYKHEKQRQQNTEHATLLREVDKKIEEQNAKMKQADGKITDQIHTLENGMNTLTSGLLSVQGHQFRNNCRELLNVNHVITLDEFEQLTRDHEVYNSLGGNHFGDKYYRMVEEKVSKDLTETKKEGAS